MELAIFVFVFAIVLFVGLGFFLLVVGLGLKRVDQRVAKEGRITEGQVTGTRKRMRSSGRTRVPEYFATIAYLVEGQSYEQAQRISHERSEEHTPELQS